jgi:hypothetical protein
VLRQRRDVVRDDRPWSAAQWRTEGSSAPERPTS